MEHMGHMGHDMNHTMVHPTAAMTNSTMDPNMAHDHMHMSTGGGGMHDMHMGGHNMTDGNMHMKGMGGMHMMKMYFHGGVEETILFECWKTTNIGTMVASFIGIFFIALLYEGLKFLREHLARKYYTNVNFSSVSVVNTKGSPAEMQKVVTSKIFSVPHFVQTLLHVLQLVISYFLMLIFMTFNVWLCLAVALGAGAGYFIFGWKKAIVVNVSEHCH